MQKLNNIIENDGVTEIEDTDNEFCGNGSESDCSSIDRNDKEDDVDFIPETTSSNQAFTGTALLFFSNSLKSYGTLGTVSKLWLKMPFDWLKIASPKKTDWLISKLSKSFTTVG